MIYEVFLIVLGIYIEQTYNLPSINTLLNKLKKDTDTSVNEDKQASYTDFIDKNFLNDFYNIFDYSKKK